MNRIQQSIIMLTLFCSYSTHATPIRFDQEVQTLLDKHATKYKNTEYFSGATLSINIPKEKIHNYYTGQVAHDANSANISAETLFEIGSITKSFTAAVMLQLEKENKLSLNDSLGKWLPDYKQWSELKLATLLNMTSGLPNYSDTPLWNAEVYKHPTKNWSSTELLDYVYPNKNFIPPLKSGYFYTNTGYVLADMIVNKITNNTFAVELTNRTIKAANLANTFYPLPNMDQSINNRLAHGYNYNQYDNPALVGNDVTTVNLSWAAAAGGIVSNAEDITRWIKALFIDNQILDSAQKKKLTSLVSVATGKPIKTTTTQDPRGFGLGVIQSYNADKSIGKFWFYEGETLGFRALYMYTPCNGLIIASIFNSATNSENDHAHELMVNAYKLVLKQYPKLHC